MNPEKERSKGHGGLPKADPGARILTFLICFITWIILSGRFDGFHLVLGVVSSTIVALISADIFFPAFRLKTLPGIWIRFLGYLPWLLYQIFRANLHVMYLVLHPRMRERIDPRVITFQSRLKGDMAFFVLANSITLTPGTVTVFVSVLGKYTVHAIDAESARGLPGIMEDKVEKIFQ